MIRLEVKKGPMQGRVFTFEGHDVFLFGRDEQNCHAFVREDPFVSRHHFLLEVNPPESRLLDLGSRNGTFVNGRRHGGRAAASAFQGDSLNAGPSVDLADGDVITAGKTVFQVFVQAETPINATCCFDHFPEDADDCDEPRFVDPPEQASVDNIRRTIVEMPAPGSMGAGRQTISESSAANRTSAGRQTIREMSTTNPNVVGRQTIVESAAKLNRMGPNAGRATIVEGMQVGSKPFASHPKTRTRSPGQFPVLEGFQVREHIGAGSLGEVFLAERTIDHSLVAIKFLQSRRDVSPQVRVDFLKQTEVHARLRHRNIVQSYASGSLGNEFYFVTEYCDGGSLAKLFREKRNSIGVKHVAVALHLLLDGLAYAHEKGLVHRGLKPSNLLVSKRRGRWIPKIGDFGMAKDFEKAGFAGLTITGSTERNLPYLPREQLTDHRSINPASDVFSLAASFYRILTGQYPREERKGSDPVSVILNGEVQYLRVKFPGLHPGLASVLDMALQDDCNRRFANAREMQLALHQVMQKEGWS